jgi:nicotinamide-nucleotide amidase
VTNPAGDVGAGPAADVLSRLLARGETLAVAESLTGGLLAATLVDVPGASAVFRGGLVVYATDLKATLAGVPEELLAQRGPVDDEVAEALAVGARDRCGADWGLATTGVAGPDPQDGHRPGFVWIACAGPLGVAAVSRQFPGDRAAVRRATVTAALALVLSELSAVTP